MTVQAPVKVGITDHVISQKTIAVKKPIKQLRDNVVKMTVAKMVKENFRIRISRPTCTTAPCTAEKGPIPAPAGACEVPARHSLRGWSGAGRQLHSVRNARERCNARALPWNVSPTLLSTL